MSNFIVFLIKDLCRDSKYALFAVKLINLVAVFFKIFSLTIQRSLTIKIV